MAAGHAVPVMPAAVTIAFLIIADASSFRLRARFQLMATTAGATCYQASRLRPVKRIRLLPQEL